ncbi:hypothetical protein N7603_08785, partial [Acholeplasma vituli]
RGETLIEALTDLSVREFTGLLSNNEYTIKVTYTYDLNDGAGSQTLVISRNISTLKMDPIVTFNITNIDRNNVSYQINILDNDYAVNSIKSVQANVIRPKSYPYAVKLKEIINLESNLYGQINNIDSGNTHVLEIVLFVDLKDGLGSREVKFEHQFKTISTPISFSLRNSLKTQDSLTFNIWEINLDLIQRTMLQIKLVNEETGEVVSSEFDELPDLQFGWIYEYEYTYSDLLSDTAYILVIEYHANISDGLGEKLFKHEIKLTTQAKSTPTVSIENVISTETSIGFDISTMDIDQVGLISAIELYRGETLIEALTDLSKREFTGLLSNTEYIIKVSYIYNLNDGEGNHNLEVRTYNYLTADKFQDSNQKEGYLWGLIHVKIDSEKSIFIINPLPKNLSVNVKVYFEDITTEEFSTLGYGDKIIVYGTFINGYVLGAFNTVEKRDTIDDVKTKEKQAPSIVIDNVVPTQESIGFGITVTDTDEVGLITAIELYKGETLIEALTDLSLREFAGLLSNNEYTVKVTYTYDLNDGVGSQALVISEAATTVAKAAPTVVIDNAVPTQESISFGITVTDVDQV